MILLYVKSKGEKSFRLDKPDQLKTYRFTDTFLAKFYINGSYCTDKH